MNQSARSSALAGWVGGAAIGLLLVLANLISDPDQLRPYAQSLLAVVLGAFPVLFLARTCITKSVRLAARSLAGPSTAVLLSYVVALVAGTPDRVGVYRVGQLASVLGFVLSASLMPWPRGMLQGICFVSSSFILVCGLTWIITGMPVPFELYANGNMVGGFIWALLFFSIVGWQSALTLVGRIGHATAVSVGVVLLGASLARGEWLASATAVVTYAAWHWLGCNRRRFVAWFLAVVSLVLLVSWGLPHIRTMSYWIGLAEVVRSYTGEPLFSGRERIWLALQAAVVERPLWGYGPGVSPREFTGIDLSAHNLFYQTSLQAGLVGLAALLAFLGSIWTLYYPGRKDSIVRCSGACFMGVLVREAFEVTLTQNLLVLGIPTWLAITAGLHRVVGRRQRR